MNRRELGNLGEAAALPGNLFALPKRCGNADLPRRVARLRRNTVHRAFATAHRMPSLPLPIAPLLKLII